MLFVCSIFLISDTSLAPIGADLDASPKGKGEHTESKIPKTRRGGCDAMLGFDCGSASETNTGPVGKLVKWMKSV